MTREEAIKWLNGIQGCYKKKFFDLDLLNGLCVEAIDMAIESLQADAEFEWCPDCKEYDQDRHCCHRWTKVIRNTVEELKEHYDGYVEVVLCKDCRYYECGGLPCPLDLCESLGDDGFCSVGERREE